VGDDVPTADARHDDAPRLTRAHEFAFGVSGRLDAVTRLAVV